MIVYLPILTAIIGVLMYALCENPKLQRIGFLLLAIGLAVTVWLFATNKIHLP